MKMHIADETLQSSLSDEPKPPKLYQLPISGGYITLADVREVYDTKGLKFSDGLYYSARVFVVTGNPLSPRVHHIDCESDEQAIAIRDQIVAAVQEEGRIR